MDVSKLDSRVRGGVFSIKLDTIIAYRLATHGSILQASIIAIKESIIVLTRSVLTLITRNIFLCTDSQATLKSLKYLRLSSKVVKEYLDLVVDPPF